MTASPSPPADDVSWTAIAVLAGISVAVGLSVALGNAVFYRRVRLRRGVRPLAIAAITVGWLAAGPGLVAAYFVSEWLHRESWFIFVLLVVAIPAIMGAFFGGTGAFKDQRSTISASIGAASSAVIAAIVAVAPLPDRARIACVLASGVAALGCAALAWHNRDRRSVSAVGYLRAEGPLLVAPLSQRPCVAYVVSLTRREELRESAPRRVLEQGWTPFSVETAEGRTPLTDKKCVLQRGETAFSVNLRSVQGELYRMIYERWKTTSTGRLLYLQEEILVADARVEVRGDDPLYVSVAR
jgi:hypothetical protein